MKHLVLVVVLDVVTVVVVLLNLDAMVVGLMRRIDWEDQVCFFEFDGYALRWWDRLVRAREEDGEPPIITWHAMKAAMQDRFVPTNYLRTIYDKLTLLRQGVKTVDEYFMEMEMLMQRGRVRESLEMTMQRFLHGLKYDIKGIVRYHSYTTMNGLLHHAREAEAQLAEVAQIKGRATGAGRFTPRAPPPMAPTPSTRFAPYYTPSSKPVSNVPNTKKSESAASTSGSSMSTECNRDMNCHTCGGKGHFKRDCPNRKVMFVNEDNEYETGDDVDPYAPEDDDYDNDGVDAYPSDARTIVVSQRALNVLPSAPTQCCNLFHTKALVGPDKACKWLSDNGEMKVNHMVRVEFEIGPNPSKEIFSELDEIFAQGPIFARSFQKTEEITKWGHEVARPRARGWPWRAALIWAPREPPDLPFRLLKASVAKPPPRATIRKTFPRRAAANPISGIQEIASGTCRRGDSSPEDSSSP
ncbi:hypothetical protein QYE76_031623 [Lolium multiflorum]|uniref:CCHC-type domain-containing protein n=1 Tax=Lolium multiflorum TaxID=4521 RepID=A0AAD8QS10_LOLMU|nr:hypothetical protein QYE76_031623 [Lolium multiflorum]